MSSLPTPPSALPLRIAIIGGGISGLAAAHRLSELLPRAEIELFEASSRLGGVLNTVKCGGYLIEQSADNFLVKPTPALDLCRHVGLADDLLTTDETRRRAFVVRAGKLVPIPEGFYLMSPRKLWPLLTSPALSISAKLRILIEPFISRAKPADTGSERADESIAAFVQRRLGREVFEQLVHPLVAGIYTADPEQLSMAATMPQFLEYERTHGSLLRATLFSRRRVGRPNDQQADTTHSASGASGARYGLFVAPKAGMTGLIAALRDRLPNAVFHLATHVSTIRAENSRWKVEYQSQSTNSNGGSPETSRIFDAVIVALPAPSAAAIFESLDEDLAAVLGLIEYTSCAVVSLGFARSQIGHALDGFGFVVPQTERRRIIAGSFASLKFPGRAPDHHVLIRVFIGGALQPEMLKLSDQELIRVARAELGELLQITGEPVVTDTARWPNSMPQYNLGHLGRVDRIESLVARHPTLALAGNAYRGVGIPQCIASGEAAAVRIASQLKKKAEEHKS